MKAGSIIGLKSGMASVTLEPGGQFELSGAPLESIHDTCTEVANHLRDVRSVADGLGIGFLGLGVQPRWALEDIPMMPKGRYKIMRAYMEKVGRLGRQMMFRSCTVQVNLDYRLRSRHGGRCAPAWRCSRLRRRCLPTARSPKGARTAISATAPTSGPIPTLTAPAPALRV
jgi:hypothetical protein